MRPAPEDPTGDWAPWSAAGQGDESVTAAADSGISHMIKWLLLVLLAAGLYFFLRRPHRQAPRPRTPLPERMVACAACGVYLPEMECVRAADGRPYCCEAHRDAGGR